MIVIPLLERLPPQVPWLMHGSGLGSPVVGEQQRAVAQPCPGSQGTCSRESRMNGGSGGILWGRRLHFRYKAVYHCLCTLVLRRLLSNLETRQNAFAYSLKIWQLPLLLPENRVLPSQATDSPISSVSSSVIRCNTLSCTRLVSCSTWEASAETVSLTSL